MLDKKQKEDDFENKLKKIVESGQINHSTNENSFMGRTSIVSEQFANNEVTNSQENLDFGIIKKPFEIIKNKFANCENDFCKYFLLDNNYSNIEACQNDEEALQILQGYSCNMNYSLANNLDKADYRELKSLLNSYKNMTTLLENEKDKQIHCFCQIIQQIINDRISILELEIMKIKKISFETIFGGRLNKLKTYNKKYANFDKTESFVQSCNAQLKKEKSSFVFTACVVLVVFLIIIVTSICIAINQPFDVVTENGVVYEKTTEYGISYYYVSKADNKETIEIKGKVRDLQVKEISAGAFSGCDKIKNVKIQNGVQYIYASAFSKCKNLTNISIPNSVEYILDFAFSNCTSLKNITLPSNLIYIGMEAFHSCSNLTEIVIPKSVVYMGNNVFYGCNKLKIYCKNTYKPTGWHTYWNGDCPVEWGYVG